MHITIKRSTIWARELAVVLSSGLEPLAFVWLSASGDASMSGWPPGLSASPGALEVFKAELRELGARRLLISHVDSSSAVASHETASRISTYRVYEGKPPFEPDQFRTDMTTSSLCETDPTAFDNAFLQSAHGSRDPFYRTGAEHSLQLLRHWNATDATGVGHAFWLTNGAQRELVAVGSYRKLDAYTALGQHVGIIPSHRGQRRGFMVGFDLAAKLHEDTVTWLISYVAEENTASFRYLEAAGHGVTGQFDLYELVL